jgi:predicted nucleic acid-binding protein
MMRLALDTNVLAYAEGVNGEAMKKIAVEVVTKLPESTTFIPVQVLGELFHLLLRKGGRTPQHAQAAISSWQDVFATIETSPAVLATALDLAVHHHFSIWDAVALSAASTAGCRLFLSQDLQDGFKWNGVTVANPFAKTKHPLLLGLLA